MKFGKLGDISNVDFGLPKNNSLNALILSKKEHPASLYLGATGWSVPEWKGNIYPSSSKTKDFLFHYAKNFNSIELNTTHYRLPEITTLKNWKNQVSADFRFCPKIWKNISHRNDLGINGNEIYAFSKSILSLEDNLGPCFLQLPPYFDFSRMPILKKCLKAFPSELKIGIEARHPSFYTKDNFEKYSALLEKEESICVITDVSGRRDIVHSRLTTQSVLIRWVGNGLHNTDYERLKEWSERIKLWNKQGVQSIYFFLHEPNNLQTPEITSYFHDLNADHFTTRGPKIYKQDKQLKLL